MEKRDVQYIANGTIFKAADLDEGTIEYLSADKVRFNYKGRNHIIHLIHAEDKSYRLKIDGYSVEIEAQDELDLLIERLGFNAMSAQSMSSVNAPMPGLVLDILVGPGDAVEKGDNMIVIEAMKMENILKAEGEGVVKSIQIEKGDKVNKGQLLIEME